RLRRSCPGPPQRPRPASRRTGRRALARLVPRSCGPFAGCPVPTSATTTLAPSWANASAAARPMPLAAPVTNATFPVKSALPWVSIRLLLRGLFRNLWVVKWVASWTQQRLDRATLIHRAVTLRDLLERQRQVEDLAGIDLALPHEVDQLGQVAAYGGRATVEVDVREEQLLPSDLD